jgi:hypothetical protein
MALENNIKPNMNKEERIDVLSQEVEKRQTFQTVSLISGISFATLGIGLLCFVKKNLNAEFTLAIMPEILAIVFGFELKGEIENKKAALIDLRHALMNSPLIKEEDWYNMDARVKEIRKELKERRKLRILDVSIKN